MFSSINDERDKKLVQSMGCQYFSNDQDPRKGPLTKCGCKELHKDSTYCYEHYFIIYERGTRMYPRNTEKARRHGLEDIKQAILDEAESYDECVQELKFDD